MKTGRATVRRVVGFPLAVIVPHFGDPELTRACVASVQRSDVSGLRVYVIDGAGAGELSRKPHKVVIVPSEGATGFSEKCNAAARKAFFDGATSVMFLNNDAITAPETPRQILNFMKETGAGIVAPVVLRLDAPGTVETAGIEFNRLTGRTLQSYAGRPYSEIRFEYRFLDAVAATCMAVTKEAAEKTGLFDPALSFYFEDVDLCLRARKRDVRIAVLKEARVWHVGAGSFRLSRQAGRAYLATRHHLEICRRHCRPLPHPLHLLREGHIIALNAACFTFTERPSSASLGAVFRGAKDHFGGCADSV